MEIHISTSAGNVLTTKILDDVEDRGEIAHFIVELEILKKELVDMFDNYEDIK